MEIAVSERVIHINILTLNGRLDAFSVQDLRQTQDGLLSDNKVNFVVDLSAVTFMDSAGMSALVSLLKRSRQAGGNVILVSPKDPAAYRILSLTSFDKVFTLVNSVDEAAKAICR